MFKCKDGVIGFNTWTATQLNHLKATRGSSEEQKLGSSSPFIHQFPMTNYFNKHQGMQIIFPMGTQLQRAIRQGSDKGVGRTWLKEAGAGSPMDFSINPSRQSQASRDESRKRGFGGWQPPNRAARQQSPSQCWGFITSSSNMRGVAPTVPPAFILHLYTNLLTKKSAGLLFF